MKHKTTFELVQNTDKKKKLEFKITTDRHPPPGFEFIPIGHPTISQLCKDLSREQDVMIFIVSGAKNPDNLDHHMNRVGYHFREAIVERARAKLMADGQSHEIPQSHLPSKPEPIPQSQEEIDAQADAVLKDLFPRIPNTDRREIIRHAFKKDGKFHGESRVGLAQELTLARRVQLAAIAHIRHTHTRYDELLKQTNWNNARKLVEKPCLAIIVKWRGDEETGRDQLDEILREVIEISDTEDSEDDIPVMALAAESTPANRVSMMPAATLPGYAPGLQAMRSADQQPPLVQRRDPSVPISLTPTRQKAIARAEKRSARRTQRFRRYAAAAEALASSSGPVNNANDSNAVPIDAVAVDLTRSPGSVHIASREPTVAARGTPSLEHMARRFELRSGSHRFNGESPRGNSGAVPPLNSHTVHDYRSPQLMYNQENVRPKVGYTLANSGQSQVPISPIRNELQDMLIQSIEPASPVASRQSQNASRMLHGEPHYLAEAPRLVSRAVYEPVSSISHPRSPRVVTHGGELATKQHHVAEYPYGQFDAHNGRLGRADNPPHGLFEYLPDRPVSSFRVADRALPQSRPWPASSESAARYNSDVSYRSRAHPIVIDDEVALQPRQVVEMQRHQDAEHQVSYYRAERPMNDVPVRGATRYPENGRIVYIDDPPSRSRGRLEYYREPMGQPSHRVSWHQESSPHRAPMTDLRGHVVSGSHSDYDSIRHEESVRSQYLVREPVNRPMDGREIRAVPPGPERPEVRYASGAHHDFYERSSYAPTSNPPQDRREVYRYPVEQPAETMMPHFEHRYAHQPQLVAPPSHGGYN